jgi:signal transduction histidine kinase/ligand-binding sensor domain-containing protein
LKWAILFTAFLMRLGSAANSQIAAHDLNTPVDKGHITAIASAIPQASVNPRPIRLPIVEGRDIRFARLSTADGMSQTKVNQIVQDDQGFMWFGTQYGVNRYDGYNFKLFVHVPRNPNSLSGVYVNALFKDRDGVLWVGCDQFLNRFNRTTETFTRYPIPFVTDISQDSAGLLWLATVEGLYSLDPKAGTIRQYSHDPNDPASLSNNNVKSSREDSERRFWVATIGYLDEFDRTTGKVTRQIPIPNAPLGFGFYEDRFGLFWIFHSSPNALSVFDRKTNRLTNYSFHELEPSSALLVAVVGMTEDRNGTLWLATHGAGLLKFDRERRRFIRYHNNPIDPNSLPQNDVENLFADREGSIWAGLGRMEVTHFATSPLPFKTIPQLAGPEGTAEQFVGAIYEDREGTLWVGTPEALNGIDRKTGHHTPYRRTSLPGAGTDVISIREDRFGNLWAGTYDHGLLRLDRRTGLFQAYRHNSADPYSLSNNIVPRLLVDHSGTLWVATDDGLNRFDWVTGRFTIYKLDPQRLVSYLELVEDRNGALWLGTDSSGLERFDPATGQFTTFGHDIDQPGTLSDNRVNSVYFDRSGTMWAGTQNGLDKFDSKTGTFTVYSGPDGMPGNAVGCILEDDHGNLWMSTNNGIARFDPQSKAIKSYSTAEGLPGPDLTGWGACFKNRSGEMFFGGFNGATVFHPDSVVDTSYTPPVVLTEFRLSGSPVDIGGGSPLSKSISYTTRLTLSHEQRIFALAFSALSYFSPVTNRYRYKLEGLDETWHEVGSNERLATYTTLPTGVYTFRVQGATSRGDWSEPGAAVLIEILPPWWSTWRFRVTCVVSALALLCSIYRLRVRSIEQRHRERKRSEEALRQAQADLAHANRVSSMGELTASLAHEVKQPIAAAITDANTCLRWLSRDQPDLEEARAAASRMVRDGTRASEIVNRVRLLFKKDTLQRELVDLNDIIQEMMLLLHSEATQFSVLARTELAADLPQVMGDRVQLQQVLMNLILNGIDATKDVDGMRELTIQSQRGEDDQILISVSDTGVGLPPQQADKIFNAFFTTKTHGTGMGLRISRSIVESHGGRLWAADNPPRGARFCFTLPTKAEAHDSVVSGDRTGPADGLPANNRRVESMNRETES